MHTLLSKFTKLSLHFNCAASSISTLSISPKHLREITDPILILLTQLHKMVYIMQLPPSPSPSAKWLVLQSCMRHWFGPKSSSTELKRQLYQLVNGVPENVVGIGLNEDTGASGGVSRVVRRALEELSEGQDGVLECWDNKGTLTYEALKHLVEDLAIKHNYYQ